MMMECPRCGFSQPIDRYCANCGLDIEKFRAKPKPLWVRLAQNPNVYLSLIAVLIVSVAGYLFYSRRGFVRQEMNTFLQGAPATQPMADNQAEVASKPLESRAEVAKKL